MTQIHVEGMSCQHCSSSVTKALEEKGASQVQIDLNTGIVSFEGNIEASSLKESIEDLGFTLKF